MKKIITALVLIFCLTGKAQYVTIPDANFVTYLQGLIPAAMNGNQMDTTSTLVTTTTQTINVSNSGITDLTGVTYFKSLKSLDCSLLFLSMPLPILPSTLIYLDCNTTDNVGAPVILPNSLTYLDCSYSQIAFDSLPHSLNTLKACYLNAILSTLPPLPNSLQYLDVRGGQIKCFPTFPTSLNTVLLSGNPYNCLPNYILPAMNSYTTTPLCGPGNPDGCAFTTGIKENASANLSIYPNPARSQFFIETNTTDKLKVYLFDVTGKQVYSTIVSDKENINVASLDNGAYTLTIKTADRAINKKLVILH